MAHEHSARIVWEREDGAPFIDNRYSRAHSWSFDGGVTVPGSSSPSVVRLPLSRAEAGDSGETFVAALSSCHMLFFLSFAAAEGLVVDRYDDMAIGVMGRDARGRTMVSKVTLHPRVTLSGPLRPGEDELAALHHHAHEECFIANSVLTEVAVEAVPVDFA